MCSSDLECRIYAEDPDNSFFPCPGLIRHIETPSGPGVRDDSGVYSGWTVPMEYDPLLSKLVAWAGTREEAIQRMRRALSEYHVSGIKTNLRFFESILNFPDFARGDLDTGLIERLMKQNGENGANASPPDSTRVRAAAIAAALFHEQAGARALKHEDDCLFLVLVGGVRLAHSAHRVSTKIGVPSPTHAPQVLKL